jgi:biopolymer transport protein ExbD
MIQGQGGGAVSGGRRRRGHRRAETSLSEINIIPLVDVMLVLLIVFMIAAPMMQSGLDVSLPEARRADPVAEDRVVVTIPISFRTDQVVQVDDDSIRVEVLAERMRQELIERTDKNVFLRGDREVTLQEAVTVMDELKEGGVVNVLLVTDFTTEL